MKKIFLLYLIALFGSKLFCQVLIVDNCYIASFKDKNKTILEYDDTAINRFVSQIKIPISVMEQKVEGHSFIEINIRYGQIIGTSPLIGIHQGIDTVLCRQLKKCQLKWFGEGKFDTVQRIILSIKINYKYCSLANLEETNLTSLEKNNDLNNQRFRQFQNIYNQYDEIFYFDSTNIEYYRKRTTKSVTNSINREITKVSWYHPEFCNKHILLDIDKNNIPNVILEHNDSVFILENNKLQFSEQGHLRFIRRLKNDIIIELESNCIICKKTNRTLTFYKKESENYIIVGSITAYSNNPQLMEKLNFTTKVVVKTPNAFIRSNPFKINEPYSGCMGVVTEEYSCVVSKTWGNIFGVLSKGTILPVIQEFSDISNKKWYYVMANRVDGLFLGWISENDIEILVENNNK